jgi:hypothetical protein
MMRAVLILHTAARSRPGCVAGCVWRLRVNTSVLLASLAAASILAAGAPALAQTTTPPAAVTQSPPDDDRPHPMEPDFKIENLPTTLILPVHKLSFSMTHRFNGNLRSGGFLDQLEGLFGLDNGASIGLELRWAPMRRLQTVIFRTNIERTIQLSAKYDWFRQGGAMPVSISPVFSFEGINNLRDHHQPGVGASISRMFGERVSAYAVPMWVHNTVEVGDDQDTTFIGIGGRWQIWTRTFLVAEFAPRVAGFEAGETMYGFGIEKRVGGHVFQLNFTNTSATTYGQIARGGFPKTLYLGFNLTRKFY